jgi:DNA-binding winged helix-turn-helix (wHTH) protein/TolB-like protein
MFLDILGAVMAQQSQHFYEFGPFRIDTTKRLLMQGGKAVPLTAKAFDLLLVLVESGGQVVDKEDLLKQVWPDSFVEEGNLTYNISILRKALGERAADHKYIVTMPGKGYRFVATVKESKAPESELNGWGRYKASVGSEFETKILKRWNGRRFRVQLFAICLSVVLAGTIAYLWIFGRPGPPSNPAGVKSIAVLPFKPLVAGSRDESLELGMADTLINKLSGIRQLILRPMSAVRKYTVLEQDPITAGRELDVDYVLEGNLQTVGEKTRATVRLLNVRDGSAVWTDKCDEQCSTIFELQDAIAERIAEALALELTSGEREQLAKRYTENLRAYQSYMLGRSYADRRTHKDLLTAISYYDKAIGEDQDYVLAYAGLADAYANLGVRGYIAPSEGRRQAEVAARKALALDDNLAEAHAAMARVYTQFLPYNFSIGDHELRRATELSPNLAIAHQYIGLSLVPRGHLDESLEKFLKARELDPLSSIIARCVALSYLLKRDDVRALEALRQANELGPTFSTTWDVEIYIQNRLYGEALAELDKAKQERKGDPILIYSTGMVCAAQGKRTEALQIIKELEAMSGTSLSQAQYIAKIYAALSERDLALTWLERGLAAGAIGGSYKDEPVWDPIRSDPRFADLMRRKGI